MCLLLCWAFPHIRVHSSQRYEGFFLDGPFQKAVPCLPDEFRSALDGSGLADLDILRAYPRTEWRDRSYSVGWLLGLVHASASPRRGARVASRAQAHVQCARLFVRFVRSSVSDSSAHAPVSSVLSMGASREEVNPSGSFPQSAEAVMMDVLTCDFPPFYQRIV